MQINDVLAYFITWTVYGTFLQGDQRGWRSWKSGLQAPKPLLATWGRERLKHRVELLNSEQQSLVEVELQRLADYRGWKLWAKSARSNHVHVVATAPRYKGSKVRDQFKANCTRVLRERDPKFIDRPVWTIGGDWQILYNEEDLAQVIFYVDEAQDRKHLEHRIEGTGG